MRGEPVDEALGGLEGGQVVGFDNERCVLRDVASGLLCAVLDDEAAEATEVDVFAIGEAAADLLHECLYSGTNFSFSDARLLGNDVDDFCLCHFAFSLMVLVMFLVSGCKDTHFQ